MDHREADEGINKQITKTLAAALDRFNERLPLDWNR